MFPNCFIYSANGMFSPINGIATPNVSTFEPNAPRPAYRAAPRADIKNRPAQRVEWQDENETPHMYPTNKNEKE